MTESPITAEQPNERIKVDVEPRRLLVTSDPYVVLTSRGYQVAIAVFERKRKRSYELLIGSKSLSQGLAPLVEENNGRFVGLDFWIRKEDGDKFSKYIVD